jgi:hypothetical protein
MNFLLSTVILQGKWRVEAQLNAGVESSGVVMKTTDEEPIKVHVPAVSHLR